MPPFSCSSPPTSYELISPWLVHIQWGPDPWGRFAALIPNIHTTPSTSFPNPVSICLYVLNPFHNCLLTIPNILSVCCACFLPPHVLMETWLFPCDLPWSPLKGWVGAFFPKYHTPLCLKVRWVSSLIPTDIPRPYVLPINMHVWISLSIHDPSLSIYSRLQSICPTLLFTILYPPHYFASFFTHCKFYAQSL